MSNNMIVGCKMDETVKGYWFTELSQIPEMKPAYGCNGGLLLNSNKKQALIIIDFDGIEYPLSEKSENLYVGPRTINDGNKAYFVIPSSYNDSWIGTIYAISQSGYLTLKKVNKKYGAIVGNKAKIDARSVEVAIEEYKSREREPLWLHMALEPYNKRVFLNFREFAQVLDQIYMLHYCFLAPDFSSKDIFKICCENKWVREDDSGKLWVSV